MDGRKRISLAGAKISSCRRGKGRGGECEVRERVQKLNYRHITCESQYRLLKAGFHKSFRIGMLVGLHLNIADGSQKMNIRYGIYHDG